MDASEVKNKLNKAIESVEVTDPDNPIKTLKTQFDERKTKSEELKTQWDEARTSLLGSLQKIEIDKDFDYDIEDDEANEVIDKFILQASRKGLEPKEANKQMILKQAKKYIEDKNWPKIKAAYRAKIEANMKAENKKQTNNQAPLNTPNPPPEPEASEAATTWRTSLGLASKKKV